MDKSGLSTQKLAELIETPYPSFVFDANKHCEKVDKRTGKFKMTILKSRKAALLWYYFL